MPSSLEIFANLFYLVSVLLAARNSVHTWAVGLVGCAPVSYTHLDVYKRQM